MNQEWIQIALTVLAASVLAVPLARKLGLGTVLGYLLAGMAIGPWGLGFIRSVDTILAFSEFGVVLLLFMIGLELEPRRLWAMRRSIFGWGSAQVLVCSAVLGLAAFALGIGWKVALVAGLGLALSSTAIALATLQERNLSATPGGSATFSILLFQDVAAIPMIALLPLLGSSASTSSTPGWLTALEVTGVIGGLVLVGRFLLRPVLRFIAGTRSREIFTSFALLLVLLIAWVMHAVGMSMALGTFMAGVLLADSEYRHALESDLEPFKGLLMGLFFTAVGMSVDFGVLRAQPWLVLGLTLGMLSLKSIALLLLARAFGIARRERFLFTILLSQGGEFAFVVFGAAASARVLSPEISALLTLVVAISMVSTPLLLVLNDRLFAMRRSSEDERPADAIVSQDAPIIIAGFGRFGQIVARLLLADGLQPTVLDHDADQVDLVRRFGFKVFYGDATRADLLHAAGAAKARVLVVAVDDVADSLELVDVARREFPQLRILARARNLTHVYDLMDRGVEVIERETFEASLRIGGQALEALGIAPARAQGLVAKFREHNLKTLLAAYPHYRNQPQYQSVARQGRKELEDMFARDREAWARERETGEARGKLLGQPETVEAKAGPVEASEASSAAVAERKTKPAEG